MFKQKQSDPVDKALDDTIAYAHEQVKDFAAAEDGFVNGVEALSKLYKIKNEATHKDRVSKDALLAVAGNLLGIGLILSFEQARVITSKALSMIIKTRL